MDQQRVQKAFYTDVKDKDPNYEKLYKYAGKLDSKIDYAKWKQKLVLDYNYIPLKRIAEKVQSQTNNYQKKVKDEEIRCSKILSGKELTVQLAQFQQFSQKIILKLAQLQQQIETVKIKNNVLEAEVEEKKYHFKAIMKQLMMIKKSSFYEQSNAACSDVSLMTRLRSKKSLTERTGKILFQRPESEKLSQNFISNNKKSLFLECLSQMIQNIQSLCSTEDVQKGIFLDVMDKPNKKYLKRNQTIKSHISHVLIEKYGPRHATKDNSDFFIEWDSFKKLNWKQIMGIVLVKDKNCIRLKKLLQYK